MAEFNIYFLMGDMNVWNASFVQGNQQVFNNMASQKDKTERTETVADAEEVTDSRPTADDGPANVGHESSNQQQTVAKTAEKPSCSIPQDCSEAISKVFTDTFSLGCTVFVSCTQIRKAAQVIDLNKNVEVAMLMAVGKELKAVKAGTKCTDFVRALIGLGAIIFKDNKAIRKMADGMSKRINGYKRNGKRQNPFPDNHLQWKADERQIGTKIYEAMKTQEN